MARCLNCGANAQAECPQCRPCDDIAPEDIVEVLRFLCVDLGFHAQLSVDNLLFSVQAVTVTAATDSQAAQPPARYPTAGARPLRRVLRALLPRTAPPADHWLTCAARLSPGNLYLELKHYGLAARIFPLLALMNRASRPAGSGRQYRLLFEDLHAREVAWAPFAEPAVADASPAAEEEPVEWQPGFLSPCLARDWRPQVAKPIKSRQPAAASRPRPTEAELYAMAELLYIERSTRSCISPLGHTSLQSYASRRRIVKAIHITAQASRQLAQLILCHELVHVALWFSEPYRRCGGSHPYEEVVCHAAMRLFAEQLAARCNAHDLTIVRYRVAVCDKDALARNATLYRRALRLFALRQTDQLVQYFFQLTHA